MKAIAYICEVKIKGTDETINYEEQKQRIDEFAQRHGITIVDYFEDNYYNFLEHDVVDRPGIKTMLECPKDYDVVLVERVWCLSRISAELKPLLTELENQGKPLIATSVLWDCVSQRIRRRYAGVRNMILQRAEEPVALMGT
jgi:DNA invertase Pin-like site-specific DNA recombinase